MLWPLSLSPMVSIRIVLLLLVILAGSLTSWAQKVPVQRIDKNTFSFSTEDIVLIRDFSIDGPSYHLTSDPYQFTLTALTPEGAIDSTVGGLFKFNLNGKVRELQFSKGLCSESIQLEKEKNLTAKLEGTNLEKSISILRVSPWSVIAAFMAFLLLTFLLRHPLARGWRKLTGAHKRA